MSRIETDHAVIQDGQLYQPGQEIPDLGSWTCVKLDSERRFYEGISRDLEKLPHYVEHGSRAQCLDTGDVYTFHAKLKKWFKL